MRKVKLVIGLGNPGKKYEKTYHNVGFLAVDFFAKNPPISNFQIPNSKLLKSDVYMNQSGNLVQAALKKYNIKPKELLVIHDDSDIELGKYKISFGRSSAGHRGVESIIKSIGTKNFWRLRIGVRRGTTRKDTRNYAEKVRVSPRSVSVSPRLRAGELVLKKINKKDWEILEKVFQTIKDEIKLI